MGEAVSTLWRQRQQASGMAAGSESGSKQGLGVAARPGGSGKLCTQSEAVDAVALESRGLQ